MNMNFVSSKNKMFLVCAMNKKGISYFAKASRSSATDVLRCPTASSVMAAMTVRPKLTLSSAPRSSPIFPTVK